VAVGDFNGDGRLDIAAVNFFGATVSILLGNGDGTFQAPVLTPTFGSLPRSLAVGDLNGDGKLDLAVTADNAGAGVYILLGNGDGTFQAPVGYGASGDSFWVSTGDLNSDGKLDLALGQYDQKSFTVFLGNGDGSFVEGNTCSMEPECAFAAMADLNGDGKLDLTVSSTENSDVAVYLGNGDGTFNTPMSYPAGSSPGPIAVGDFNGDGRLDLATAPVSVIQASAVAVLLQQPVVSLSPPSLQFPAHLIGTSSATETVTLTNANGLPLTISSIAVTGTDAGDFGQTNTCGSGLPVGGSCTITVTFTPAQAGPRAASVTITDNAAGSAQSVALSGTGAVEGPNATLSPPSLTFATQLLNTTSPAQTVTLTDYGTAALSISSISFTGADPGEFAQTNTCGSSVAPRKSCTISVTFTPAGINTRTASLSIGDNAAGSPQTVSLSGTGTEVELNPSSLNFGSVYKGQTATRTTTLTNVGSMTLSVTAVAITGSGVFSETNNCGTSVRAGGSCTITVKFTPGVGTYSGDVTVTDNGGGSPQQVPLSGSGFCNHPFCGGPTEFGVGTPPR
jgi:hypothetical protein